MLGERFPTFRKLKSRVGVGDKVFSVLASRLWRTHVVAGPRDRLSIASGVSCQNTLFNTRSGLISVGQGSFFGHGVMVLTGTHDITPGAADKRGVAVPSSGFDIRIGNNVWVGSGAIIVGPADLADEVVVAAGAVVRGVVGFGQKVGGVPARPIGASRLTAERIDGDA